MKNAIGIIPARFESTRFPGKPLAVISGKPMIQRVYERARRAGSLKEVLVATDDVRILDFCRGLQIPAVMTSTAHRSGTDRIAEAARGTDASLIVNIQGDEPVIDPAMIDRLTEAFDDDSVVMASLMKRGTNEEEFRDKNRVKVVTDGNGDALYFSRSPVPHGSVGEFFLHVGLYGYRRDFLFLFCGLPSGPLEKTEKLEQLRALEHGYKIKMIETSFSSLSVDCPQDIIKIENHLREKGYD